jgi:hypothetical protein
MQSAQKPGGPVNVPTSIMSRAGAAATAELITEALEGEAQP